MARTRTHQRWLNPPTGRCGGACQTLGRSCEGIPHISKAQDGKHGVGLVVKLTRSPLGLWQSAELLGSICGCYCGHTSLVRNTCILPLKIANTRRKNAPALHDKISLQEIDGREQTISSQANKTCWSLAAKGKVRDVIIPPHLT